MWLKKTIGCLEIVRTTESEWGEKWEEGCRVRGHYMDYYRTIQLNQVELGKGYVSLLEGLYFDSAE